MLTQQATYLNHHLQRKYHSKYVVRSVQEIAFLQNNSLLGYLII